MSSAIAGQSLKWASRSRTPTPFASGKVRPRSGPGVKLDAISDSVVASGSELCKKLVSAGIFACAMRHTRRGVKLPAVRAGDGASKTVNGDSVTHTDT